MTFWKFQRENRSAEQICEAQFLLNWLCVYRCCWPAALHHPPDRCQHQQPAQSPHLVRKLELCDIFTLFHMLLPLSQRGRVELLNQSFLTFLPFFRFPSFNRIDIPPYEHYDKLYDKLLTAIEETCGFAVEWVAAAGGAQQQPGATLKTGGVKHGCFTPGTLTLPGDKLREAGNMSPDSGCFF